jgi:oligosaccharide reducing-end xylanase
MFGRRSGVRTALAVLALASAACGSTTDSLGYNGPGGIHLRPLNRLPSYPAPFREIHTDAEIASKLASWFTQLFHGDMNTAAIYFPIGADQANVQDILHDKQVRTEGIGLAMMIAIQLDKREEFDRLWTYATQMLEYEDPPKRGYFQSWCNTPNATTQPCDDPFGEQQMTMALIFAHDRWGSTTTLDYETAALNLLTVMRHKQDENGGVVDGVTDTFDAMAALPYVEPTDDAASLSSGSPSIAMPAYYDLWAWATGDSFWTRAAASSRTYWQNSAHPKTGLLPVRATFAGQPVPPWDNFLAESYRAQINMALDQIWTLAEPDAWEVSEANTLLAFFSSKGINSYGATFTWAGGSIDINRDNGLIAVNGVTAMIATKPLDRVDYITKAWDLGPPTGIPRYYSGILGLTSLLILSGQYQVW